MRMCLTIAVITVALAAGSLFAKTDEEKERAKIEKRERSEAKKTEKSSKADRDVAAASATPAPGAGYDGYRYVRGRNIFDPNRRGMKIETPGGIASTTPRGRSLALTGTMVTDGKSLAFFGGSAAEGSRVVPVGNTVAGYKLVEIESARVALEKDGKRVALNIGRQITFDSAPGEVGAAVTPIVEPAAPAAAEATGVPSLPGITGDKSDVLRRMMERRAKEMGQ